MKGKGSVIGMRYEQSLHLNIENPRYCVYFTVGGGTYLPFELRVTGWIDIATESLHFRNEIFLFYATFFPQTFNVFAHHIAVTIIAFSDFHITSPLETILMENYMSKRG